MYCKSYKLYKSEAIILLMFCYPFFVLVTKAFSKYCNLFIENKRKRIKEIVK